MERNGICLHAFRANLALMLMSLHYSLWLAWKDDADPSKRRRAIKAKASALIYHDRQLTR